MKLFASKIDFKLKVCVISINICMRLLLESTATAGTYVYVSMCLYQCMHI